MSYNDNLALGGPTIPSAAEASRIAREAKQRTLVLPHQVATALAQAQEAGLFEVELPSVANENYVIQLLESRGYTCQRIQTGINEYGVLVRWPEAEPDPLAELRAIVSKLVELVFASRANSVILPHMRRYVSEANQTALLTLLRQFAHVYAEGVSVYHEWVYSANQGWDDPKQSFGQTDMLWLHNKGMRHYTW